MTLAVFRAMLLGLVRDPGALVMAFAVPVVFFVIFAEIFASASAGEFRLRVAVSDEQRNAESMRLLAALHADKTVSQWVAAANRDEVLRSVRHGDADVGLVIRDDGEPLGAVGGFGAAPLLIYVDPSGPTAGALLAGRLQQAYARAMPDLLIAGIADVIANDFTELDERQHEDVRAGIDGLRRDAERGAPPPWSLADLIEEQPVTGRPASMNRVAYYAGAIAFMFLLFSASQAALSLFDERDSGVLHRMVAGPGGIAVVVNGKFLFLTIQGVMQTAVIFSVAWVVYGVDVAAAPFLWSTVALLSSASAAAIALTLVTVCRSRAQAQTLSSAAVLIVSAIGGSMVPRFFMPGWLRQLGWLTPNTWVLEAYSGVLWREETLRELATPLAMLLATTVAALAVVHLLARRLAAG